MLYKYALPIARQIKLLLEPFCQRIEIAGSVRRLKPDVGDIELCAIPQMVPGNNMFGDPISALAEFDYDQMGHVIKGGQRYVQIALHQGINLDLFIVLPPASWGVIYTLRTGPADFSQKCVTQRKKGGLLPSFLRVKDGTVQDATTGEIIPTPEEEDFFKVLKLNWISPDKRQ